MLLWIIGTVLGEQLPCVRPFGDPVELLPAPDRMFGFLNAIRKPTYHKKYS